MEFPSEQLARVFKNKYDVRIETMANIVGGGIMTVREDGKDFSIEQMAFIEGFESCALIILGTREKT